MQTEKDQIYIMVDDLATSVLSCIERWVKACKCVGPSEMPGFIVDEKGTYRESHRVAPGPVCKVCGKAWKKWEVAESCRQRRTKSS